MPYAIDLKAFSLSIRTALAIPLREFLCLPCLMQKKHKSKENYLFVKRKYEQYKQFNI